MGVQEEPRSRRAAGGTESAKSGVPSSIGVCPAPPATHRSISAAIDGEGRRQPLFPQKPISGGYLGLGGLGIESGPMPRPGDQASKCSSRLPGELYRPWVSGTLAGENQGTLLGLTSLQWCSALLPSSSSG